jgi:hypothetical protein
MAVQFSPSDVGTRMVLDVDGRRVPVEITGVAIVEDWEMPHPCGGGTVSYRTLPPLAEATVSGRPWNTVTSAERTGDGAG